MCTILSGYTENGLAAVNLRDLGRAYQADRARWLDVACRAFRDLEHVHHVRTPSTVYTSITFVSNRESESLCAVEIVNG